MKFNHTKAKVLNRGIAPDAFLTEMVEWAKSAPNDIFDRTATVGSADIYNKVFAELGPYEDITHRKAVMLEVMRVLAGFESSWDWTEGVDTSRAGSDTPENSEAGAWQVSYDARKLGVSVSAILLSEKISDGITFQRKMKFDHPLAMEFVASLMRINTKHNGPLYKGAERNIIRKSLRGEEHSIFPWLKKESVDEFRGLLQ